MGSLWLVGCCYFSETAASGQLVHDVAVRHMIPPMPMYGLQEVKRSRKEKKEKKSQGCGYC